MRLHLEKTFSFLAMACLLFAAGPLHSHPLTQVDPEEPLYQRVKKLGDFGLLDEADRARLQQGETLTRIELAFYTEKAKLKIHAPEGDWWAAPATTPTPPEPTSPGLPEPTLPAAPEPPPPAVPSAPAPEPAPEPAPVPETAPEPPPPAPLVPSEPTPQPPSVPPSVEKEVDDILKELQKESSFLQARLDTGDERLNRQADELARMREVQEGVDKAWKKANKVSGSPNFSTMGRFTFEHLHLSPMNPASAASTLRQNASRAVNQVNLGMWSDLGGKGSISVGMSGFVPFSNASAGPASISAFSPKIQLIFDGPLGRWDTNATVEGYVGATTLGDLLRGVAPTSLKRYEKPFEVKNFDDPPNKGQKLWDDYMGSVGFVASSSYASGAVQSTSDRVFDGVYALGSNLPLVSPDARLSLLIGRMGNTSSETQKWEKAFKYQQPWFEGGLRTSLGMIAVDDYMANPVGKAQVNLRTYASDIGINLAPFSLVLQGGYSTLRSGAQAVTQTLPPGVATLPDTKEYGGPAAKVSAALYPLTLNVFAVSDHFANFQSKAMMGGLAFDKLGISFSHDKAMNMYGALGEVDQLQNNRWGWHANLGWNGRKQDWMKGWPKFLDTFTVNFDVAQKTEYTTMKAEYRVASPPSNPAANPAYHYFAHNVVEPFHTITFYYPDDTGLWGSHMWGGYGSANRVRQDFINNVQTLRKDGNTSGDVVRWQFQLTSERIPLVAVVNGAPLDSSGGADPTTVIGSMPLNIPVTIQDYYVLPHKKSYQYVTLTTKWRLNELFGLDRPLYASLYFTRNQVSGVSESTTLPAGVPLVIPDLFNQFALDTTFMVRVHKTVSLLGNFGMEDWRCAWTWPLIEYHTRSFGTGLTWDLPWGGGKFEVRYKHLTFEDVHVQASSYQADQIFSQLQLAF